LKNRKIIEEIFFEVLGEPLGVTCLVKKRQKIKLSDKETGRLTDMNVVMPVIESAEELVEALDGGLPMV